jgi:hypothetical protein
MVQFLNKVWSLAIDILSQTTIACFVDDGFGTGG